MSSPVLNGGCRSVWAPAVGSQNITVSSSKVLCFLLPLELEQKQPLAGRSYHFAGIKNIYLSFGWLIQYPILRI